MKRIEGSDWLRICVCFFFLGLFTVGILRVFSSIDETEERLNSTDIELKGEIKTLQHQVDSINVVNERLFEKYNTNRKKIKEINKKLTEIESAVDEINKDLDQFD